MGQHLRDAQAHFKEIERLHKHAGDATGYKDALYYDSMLSTAMSRAHKSKNEKGDVAEIYLLVQAAQPLMAELKLRRDELE